MSAQDFFDRQLAEQRAAMTPIERIKDRIEWTRRHHDEVECRISALAESGAALAAQADQWQLKLIFQMILEESAAAVGLQEIDKVVAELDTQNGGAA